MLNKIGLLVSLGVLFCGGAWAQTAQITGLVTDPNGAAVPGAAVTARNLATDINTETVTNGQGYYTLPSLHPGRYEISVQKTGFRTTMRPDVKLDVSQVARIDLGLIIGGVRESVTVSSEAPLLATLPCSR
jgi:hypothetical protein